MLSKDMITIVDTHEEISVLELHSGGSIIELIYNHKNHKYPNVITRFSM